MFFKSSNVVVRVCHTYKNMHISLNEVAEVLIMLENVDFCTYIILPILLKFAIFLKTYLEIKRQSGEKMYGLYEG